MIAVINAVRLSDCYLELARIYEAMELKSSDSVVEQMELYRRMSGHLESNEQVRWIKANIMSDKAITSLRNAVFFLAGCRSGEFITQKRFY